MRTNRQAGQPPRLNFRWLLALAGVVVIAAAFSASTLAAGKAGAPVNTCPPTLDGAFVVGKAVTTSNGCWSNNPTSYTYKWSRCNSQAATACGVIAGANEKTYTPTEADVGHSLVALVSASNAAGAAAPVTSKPSEPVSAAAAPVFKTRPTINGDNQLGEPLVATTGTFSGGIPRKVTFQWQSCDQTGHNCKDIAGATGASYGIRSADVDRTLQVVVKASNDYGTVSSTSNLTGVVKSNKQAPAAKTNITASRAVTICCQAVRLSGRISTGEGGQTVLILARNSDWFAPVAIKFATTDENGNWTAVVRPHIETTYRAQVGTEPTAGITVHVRPRVGLGISGHRFTTKVTARDSFAGSLVLLQRRSGHGWVTVQRIVLNLNSAARFAAKLPHGTSLIRAVLPARAAGPGYMTGISKTLRVHR
jgi:hypothetical protein